MTWQIHRSCIFYFFSSFLWLETQTQATQCSSPKGRLLPTGAGNGRLWLKPSLSRVLGLWVEGPFSKQTERLLALSVACKKACLALNGLERSLRWREKPRCSLPVSFASRAWGTTSTPKWRGLVNDLTAYFLLLLPFLPHFLILNKAFLYHYCFYLMTYC